MAINPCILAKGLIREALRIINADHYVQVPGTIPENGWEVESRRLENLLLHQPPTLSPRAHLLHLFEEEDNIVATPSLELKAGESPPSLASNSEDVPQDGQSVKGNVGVPPPTPHSSASFDPTTHDDTHAYVSICWERFLVPRGIERA